MTTEAEGFDDLHRQMENLVGQIRRAAADEANTEAAWRLVVTAHGEQILAQANATSTLLDYLEALEARVARLEGKAAE